MKARKNDPATSHEAARSVRNISQTQEYILRSLSRPRTDAEIAEAYRNLSGAPKASESGLRTRREELVKAGMVRDSGLVRLTPFGRRSIVWERADV